MSAEARIAAVQLNVTDDRARNFEQATGLIERAVKDGAQFVATPENSDMIAPRELRVAGAEPLDGAFVSSYRALARQHGIWLLLGSFAERSADSQKVHNTSVLIDNGGEIRAVYRKIHLFDATPPDGIPYRESDGVVAGSDVVTTETPWARLGMSICYDLRFPELYRQFATRGATLLTVPAAFTVPTGHAHWEVLLRARAIENLSFVVASAQVGEHGHNRRSYGHSMIVSPWGEVLADAGGDGPGVVIATYSAADVAKARTMIPALTHRRLT
jgi:predicted amidohydrolase